MASSWRWWLVIAALLGAMMLAACGGDDEGTNGNGPTDEGVATTQPADGAVENGDGEEDGNGGDGGVEAGGDAFDNVPVPSGARETGSGQWSGSVPGIVPGQGAEPGDYSSIQYKEYEVDGSPGDIIDFFQNELDGWDEAFVFSGGEEGDEGGVGVWTRDDGAEAVWVTASSSDGGSDLVIIHGSSD